MPFLEEQSQSFFSIEDICKAFSTIEALFKTSYPDSPTFERLFQGLLFNVRPFESLFSFGRPFKVVTLSKISSILEDPSNVFYRGFPRVSISEELIFHREPFLVSYFLQKAFARFSLRQKTFSNTSYLSKSFFSSMEALSKAFSAKEGPSNVLYIDIFFHRRPLQNLLVDKISFQLLLCHKGLSRGFAFKELHSKIFLFQRNVSKILPSMKVLSKASHLLKKSQSRILQNIFRWYYLLQKIFVVFSSKKAIFFLLLHFSSIVK